MVYLFFPVVHTTFIKLVLLGMRRNELLNSLDVPVAEIGHPARHNF